MSLSNRVWINVPYNREYLPFRHAIEVVLWLFNLEPVLADDETRPDIRVEKLLPMIQECSFGITEVGGGPRSTSISRASYNMPFEHGIMWQLSTLPQFEFHPPILLCYHRIKNNPDIWFSNVRGTDALGHENKPEQLIRKLQHWITTDATIRSITGIEKNELSGLAPELIVAVWRATWLLREHGTPRDELQQLVRDASIQLRRDRQTVIGGELIAPKKIRCYFPSGFQKHRGHDIKLGTRSVVVPFVLYHAMATRSRSIAIDSSWTIGTRYFQLPDEIRSLQKGLLASYRQEHGDYGENEKVTRLESVSFHKEKPLISLKCRRLRRWDVVATNWMLDHRIKGYGSLRRWCDINGEILSPVGLSSSLIGNTLGVSLIVGNPTRREILLASRSKAVNHPFPDQITVSASGEVRPSEWEKQGPNPIAAAERLAEEEVGLSPKSVGEPKCIGIGRSVLDAVPELLFELVTEAPLEANSASYGRLQSWQHAQPIVVSCDRRTPEVTSWLMQAARWSPAHLACCHLYLKRHHPNVLGSTRVNTKK